MFTIRPFVKDKCRPRLESNAQEDSFRTIGWQLVNIIIGGVKMSRHLLPRPFFREKFSDCGGYRFNLCWPYEWAVSETGEVASFHNVIS